MPRRRRNFKDTYSYKLLPVLAGQKETSRKHAEDLYVYPKLKKFPIGDEFHARLALIYVMSPTLSKYRKKVIQAVKQAYPDVAWGRWWNSHRKDHPDLKNWGDYVNGMKSNPRKRSNTSKFIYKVLGDKWDKEHYPPSYAVFSTTNPHKRLGIISRVQGRNRPKPHTWKLSYRSAIVSSMLGDGGGRYAPSSLDAEAIQKQYEDREYASRVDAAQVLLKISKTAKSNPRKRRNSEPFPRGQYYGGHTRFAANLGYYILEEPYYKGTHPSSDYRIKDWNGEIKLFRSVPEAKRWLEDTYGSLNRVSPQSLYDENERSYFHIRKVPKSNPSNPKKRRNGNLQIGDYVQLTAKALWDDDTSLDWIEGMSQERHLRQHLYKTKAVGQINYIGSPRNYGYGKYSSPQIGIKFGKNEINALMDEVKKVKKPKSNPRKRHVPWNSPAKIALPKSGEEVTYNYRAPQYIGRVGFPQLAMLVVQKKGYSYKMWITFNRRARGWIALKGYPASPQKTVKTAPEARKIIEKFLETGSLGKRILNPKKRR